MRLHRLLRSNRYVQAALCRRHLECRGLQETTHFENTYTDGKLTRAQALEYNTARTFTYDGEGRLGSLTDEEGTAIARVTTFRYDTEGRHISQRSDFFERAFSYDSQGILVGVTTDGFEWDRHRPDGHPESRATFSYNLAGGIREVVLDETSQGEDVPTTTDGVADQRDRFSGSCGSIIMLWPDIAHLPSP
jgi:YD repeat-containing protein